MNNFAAVGLAGAAGLAVTTGLGFAMVPWLRKLKFGQTILDIGPKWHKSKQGTPTMGGLMFIIGTVTAIAVTVITDKLTGGDIVASGSLVPSEMYTRLWSGLVMALSFRAYRLCRRLYQDSQRPQPRADNKAKDTGATACLRRLPDGALYEHGRRAVYVRAVRRHGRDRLLPLDIRHSDNLCERQRREFHRRRGRTLQLRHRDGGGLARSYRRIKGLVRILNGGSGPCGCVRGIPLLE